MKTFDGKQHFRTEQGDPRIKQLQTQDSPATLLTLTVSRVSSGGSSSAAARSPGSTASFSPTGLCGGTLSLQLGKLVTDMLSDMVVGLIGRSASSCKHQAVVLFLVDFASISCNDHQIILSLVVGKGNWNLNLSGWWMSVLLPNQSQDSYEEYGTHQFQAKGHPWNHNKAWLKRARRIFFQTNVFFTFLFLIFLFSFKNVFFFFFGKAAYRCIWIGNEQCCRVNRLPGCRISLSRANKNCQLFFQTRAGLECNLQMSQKGCLTTCQCSAQGHESKVRRIGQN